MADGFDGPRADAQCRFLLEISTGPSLLAWILRIDSRFLLNLPLLSVIDP